MIRPVRTAAQHQGAAGLPCQLHDRSQADRLREARGILAAGAQHPGTRLILAARVVIALSADDAEVGAARDLRRSLDPRPLATVAQALAARRCSKGGRTAQ